MAELVCDAVVTVAGRLKSQIEIHVQAVAHAQMVETDSTGEISPQTTFLMILMKEPCHAFNSHSKNQ